LYSFSSVTCHDSSSSFSLSVILKISILIFIVFFLFWFFIPARVVLRDTGLCFISNITIFFDFISPVILTTTTELDQLDKHHGIQLQLNGSTCHSRPTIREQSVFNLQFRATRDSWTLTANALTFGVHDSQVDWFILTSLLVSERAIALEVERSGSIFVIHERHVANVWLQRFLALDNLRRVRFVLFESSSVVRLMGFDNLVNHLLTARVI